MSSGAIMRSLSIIAAMGTIAAFGMPRAAEAYRCTHEVLPGETLKELSRRYRVPVQRLRRLNRMSSNHLRAGRELKVVTSLPCRSRRKTQHVVARGDTLGRVAKRYKMKLWLLKRLNARQLSRVPGLRPGQRLTVVVEGPAPDGGVKGLYQMESGPGFEVRHPARAWGTFLTITRLHDVLTSYRNRFPRSRPVRVLDLSQRGGGPFPPHKSHRSGHDVDLAYVLKPRYDDKAVATPSKLDLGRTWYLVRSLIETGDVTYIFMDWSMQRALYDHAVKRGVARGWLDKVFQYPRSRQANHGLIRDDPGHDTHFHVRFRRETARPKPVI